LYSVFLKLTYFFISIFKSFNPKIRAWVDGQILVWDDLKGLNPENRPLLWFHTASVGEFEQGRPLIERIRREYPNHFLLLSFFSPSGYNHLKNYSQVDKVCYLPLDTQSNVNQFLKFTQPKMAIFIKYEYWPNYINQISAKKIPLILVSAIFRENQVFFKWYGGFFIKLLKKFDKIYLQNKKSHNLLNSIGINKTQVVGDTRFDRVLENSKSLKDWEIKTKFIGRKSFIVCGSVWEEDMQRIIPLINNSLLDYRWIIVPHEIKSDQMKAWESRIDKSLVYSTQAEKTLDKQDVMIVDEMGKLSGLYKGASFAYIGGAFKKGLHNTLEAAVFGPPIFFGNKNYEKFDEAINLVNNEIAFPIETDQEILEKILYLEKNKKEREKIEEKSLDFILGSKGATEKIFDYIQTKNV
jgi:3-deoxy-D-manno-octulosonic-acid transferase